MGSFALLCAVQNKSARCILFLKDKGTSEEHGLSVYCYSAGREVSRLESRPSTWALSKTQTLKIQTFTSKSRFGRNKSRKIIKTLNKEELCHLAANYSDENKDEIQALEQESP